MKKIFVDWNGKGKYIMSDLVNNKVFLAGVCGNRTHPW